MAKKMFLPFLLNIIEKKSTQKNKYNVVRNKNSQKSDCVVHYMLWLLNMNENDENQSKQSKRLLIMYSNFTNI